MQTYEIIVSERSVRANSKDMTLVRTSVGIDQVHVLFDNDEWLDFPITCTFAQGEDIVTIPLDVTRLHDSEWVAEATVIVPYEVIDMVGSIRVTLQGTDSDGRHIITAKGSPLSVEESGDVLDGSAPSEYPTISEWQQAYADAQEIIDRVDGILDDLLDGTLDDVLDGIDERVAEAIRDAINNIEWPDEYVLPTATDERLGGVKIGSGIGVTEDGTIFVSASSTSSSIKINPSDVDRIIKIVDATIGVTYKDGEIDTVIIKPESVPVATTESIGGVIPDGDTITVDEDGTIHGVNQYVLPMASSDVLGGVRVDGDSISIDENGVLHGADQAPVATDVIAGKVRPDGSTITIDDDGTIHSVETDPTVPAWAKEPDKPTYTADEVGALPSGIVGVPGGVASLDDTGKVPSSQLPSYVSTIAEYASFSDFPPTGDVDRIYVDASNNKTYRWSGSTYVEISKSLALGETSLTAYRGDYGKVAYDHAMLRGLEYQSGLYKIATNSEGHVVSASHVTKDDIVALGIPGDSPENVSELRNDVKYITRSDIATDNAPGVVRPDGTTITIDGDGTIHGVEQYTLPTATTEMLGGVIPDGDTIAVDDDGTIHAIGSATSVDKTRDPYWALVKHDDRTRLAIVIPEVT